MKLTGENHAVPFSYRPDLQGLRAIAVTLVVLAHAGVPIVAGGFVGVDVFFVLSGYLISGLIVREYEQTGHISFVRFYARRLKRLLPALALMLCITMAAASWPLSPEESRTQLASLPFATTWISNFYFAFREHGYFDELAERDLFLHTWSLGVEEQYYLAWPLLVLALLLATHRQRIVRPTSAALAILGCVFLASLGLSLHWLSTTPHAAFYLMPSRVWQFTLGAAIYVGLTSDISQDKGTSAFLDGMNRSLLLAFGLLLIVGSAVALPPNLAYPGLWALAPSLGGALVIAAGHGFQSRKSPIAHPALVWIGDRSYSWYLWHWPILMLGFSLGFEGQPFSVFGLILLSLLAAILSYHLVELPFWKGKQSHLSHPQTLAAGLIGMGVVIVISMQVLRSPPSTLVTPSTHTAQWRSDFPAIYFMSCDAWYHHARVEPCVFGPDDAPHTVVLIGDSIGVQWFSAVSIIFREPNWRTIVLTKSSCAMLDEEYVYPRAGGPYRVCTEWRNLAIDEIAKIQPDMVIIGSAATYGFSETQWVEGSARILARLSEAASKVIVIPGTPVLGFDGPGCLARNQSPEGQIPPDVCTADSRTSMTRDVTNHLQRAAARYSNVHVLDLNDLVCPDDICRAFSHDGLAVFRDTQHLTDSFVRARIPIIQERLQRY
jgi:peptidoglycan/LPS O-acetylase OafA/YrhL